MSFLVREQYALAKNKKFTVVTYPGSFFIRANRQTQRQALHLRKSQLETLISFYPQRAEGMKESWPKMNSKLKAMSFLCKLTTCNKQTSSPSLTFKSVQLIKHPGLNNPFPSSKASPKRFLVRKFTALNF